MAGLLEQLSKGLFGLAPIPAPNGVFGQALDSAAQWGRGVQDKAANIQSTLADLIRNPSNALPNIPPEALANLLQQPVTPEQKQNIARKALDFGMEFGPLATVWHGSPHLFKKFDMSKIGTGEGAQAYGHGLYLAENPSVAKDYANKLGGGDTYIRGQLAHKEGTSSLSLKSDYPAAVKTDGEALAADAMSRFGNAKDALSFIESRTSAFGGPSIDAKNEAIGLIKNGAVEFKTKGNLYKVDLPDEHIAKMLDWDKPLSQQAPEVQSLIKKAHELRAKQTGAQFTLDMNMKGGDWLPTIGEGRLKQVGIPGIRYLDGGSRAGGKGTSNFVVFDDAIPKIIGRE